MSAMVFLPPTRRRDDEQRAPFAQVRLAASVLVRAATPQGAAFAGFTMICGFDRDITQAIANGAMVEVDPTGERPFIRVID
jgi:hypothetical protein